MTPLDDKTIMSQGFAVDGVHLVEASAGTGKTYCIQSIFLRLVLVEGTHVRNILVVTFTEAATKELRERLRSVLEKARRYLENGEEDAAGADSGRLKLAVECARAKGASDSVLVARVKLALLDFDEAGISTIHGFCNRVLNRYAFECGTRFDSVLTTDSAAYVDDLSMDLWRRKTLGGTLECAVMGGYGSFRDLAANCLRKRNAPTLPAATVAAGSREEVKRQCRVIADRWARDKNAIKTDLREALTAGFLNKSICNELPADLTSALAPLLKGGTGEAAYHGFIVQAERFESVRMKPDKRYEYCRLQSSARAFARLCEEAKEKVKGVKVSAGRWKYPAGQDRVRADWEAFIGRLKGGFDAARDNIESLPDWFFDGKVRKTAMLASLKDMDSDPNTLKTVFTLFAKYTTSDPRRAVKWTPAEGTASMMAECDKLNALKEEYCANLKGQWADEIRAAYVTVKEKEGLVSYDDMLLDLHAALQDGNTGDALAGRLREEYRAALIDEFQDTDPVQYGIFRKVFMNDAGLPVYLVGDPKQAIYSFRGGDIYTYYAATGVPGLKSHTLSRNYRSEKNLIEGVNTVFKDSAGSRAFIHEKIRYAGNLDAEGKGDGGTLKAGGRRDETPFRIWYYRDIARLGAATGGDRSNFILHVYEAVAEEISSILMDPALRLGERSVRCSDMAVLVKTHKEAKAVKKALSRRKIPAVLQKTGNVFESDTAGDMLLLIKAMAEGGNARSVIPALTAFFFNFTDAEILGLQNFGSIPGRAAGNVCGTLDRLVEEFRLAHAIWMKRSFIEAFNHVCLACTFRENMLKSAAADRDAEREITNMLQLAELLHRASVEGHLNINSTVKWFVGQMTEAGRGDADVNEMRLERDSDAVKIMTIFKSKGLQFPIVFVPTMWRNRSGRGGSVEYHDADNTLVLDLCPSDDTKRKAAGEKMEEEIRNLYVAATRAVNRTYLVWFDIAVSDPKDGEAPEKDKAHSAATAHVLDECNLRVSDTVRAAVGRKRAAEPADVADFDMADPTRPGVKISVKSLRRPSETPYVGPLQVGAGAGLVAPVMPAVDKAHGHTSFTDIAPPHRRRVPVEAEVSPKDHDSGDDEVDHEEERSSSALTIFSFTGGEKTGSCWHSILEDIAFDADDRALEDMVKEKLAAYGIIKGKDDEEDAARARLVKAMVGTVLQADLGGGVRLKDVGKADRVSEMQFDFALKDGDVNTGRIRDIIGDHWRNDPVKSAFVGRLDTWNKTVPRGFLTGSIDLVFRHGRKYYIADWKSNRLDGTPAGFNAEGMAAEMAENAYFLQYLVYTVALDKYLKGCLKDYNYEQHFGGVFYLFLRGVTRDGRRGVYHDRPEKKLVDELRGILGGG